MQKSATGPAATGPGLATVDRTTTAVIRGTVAEADLPSFYDRSFGAIATAIAAQGANITGPAFGLYRGDFGDPVDLEVGFPVDRAIEQDGDVAPGQLPGGRVARLTHAGAFDGLPGSWTRLCDWITEQGMRTETFYWESYVTEPTPDMDPADLRVELIMPLAD
ncbi:GyrI-like domain-containing protein [Streptomonospora sediminis]